MPCDCCYWKVCFNARRINKLTIRTLAAQMPVDSIRRGHILPLALAAGRQAGSVRGSLACFSLRIIKYETLCVIYCCYIKCKISSGRQVRTDHLVECILRLFNSVPVEQSGTQFVCTINLPKPGKASASDEKRCRSRWIFLNRKYFLRFRFRSLNKTITTVLITRTFSSAHCC